MNKLHTLDEYLFRLINSSGWQQMDDIMIMISSKYIWIPLYLFILYNLFQLHKKNFYKILFSLILLIFFTDMGSVEIFKETFQRLRPCHALQDIRLVDNCGGKFGFVSSHSSNSFAIAFFISLLMKNKWWFFSLFSWATLISYSRVYLGVHYPFDVLCGMFWGLFVSLLVYFVYKMKLKKFDNTWAVWFLLVCIWNFGWSNAPAIADVFVAVGLSLLVIYFKKKNK